MRTEVTRLRSKTLKRSGQSSKLCSSARWIRPRSGLRVVTAITGTRVASHTRSTSMMLNPPTVSPSIKTAWRPMFSVAPFSSGSGRRPSTLTYSRRRNAGACSTRRITASVASHPSTSIISVIVDSTTSWPRIWTATRYARPSLKRNRESSIPSVRICGLTPFPRLAIADGSGRPYLICWGAGQRSVGRQVPGHLVDDFVGRRPHAEARGRPGLDFREPCVLDEHGHKPLALGPRVELPKGLEVGGLDDDLALTPVDPTVEPGLGLHAALERAHHRRVGNLHGHLAAGDVKVEADDHDDLRVGRHLESPLTPRLLSAAAGRLAFGGPLEAQRRQHRIAPLTPALLEPHHFLFGL